ncbi:MAG: hypothetical protein PHX46_02570 [Bacilli bacterium]|nr:hypothetical protein [Bacilli bacterium]
MRIIEYNEKWYDEKFHNSKELELSIDSLFSQIDYICYLYKNKQIRKNEFNIFEYEIKRVCVNKQSQNYLLTTFNGSEIKKFKSSQESSYIRRLNF